jgi:Cell Wall Hydrolase.
MVNRVRFPLLAAVAIATAATAHAAPRVTLGLSSHQTSAVDTTIFLSAHGETTLRLHRDLMSTPKQNAPTAKTTDKGDAPTHRVTISQIDADAIGRVAYAEAGNQGPAGLMAVIDTILNRARSGAFPRSIRALLDAPNQFQTVTDAGGSWRNLPPLTLMQQVQYRTILDLINAGVCAISPKALSISRTRH